MEMLGSQDVKKMVGDNVICLQGLHRNVTEEKLWKELKTVGSVQKIKHLPSATQSVAYVEFATEVDALNAAMRYNQEILLEKMIRVTIEKTPEQMKTIKSYHLKNLPRNTRSQHLWQYLTKFGYIFCVTVKYERGTTNCLGYGFVEVLGDNEFDTLIEKGQSIEIPNISILTGEEITEDGEQPVFLTVEKYDLPQTKTQQPMMHVVNFTDQLYLNWTDADEKKWNAELTEKFNSICDGKVSSIFLTIHSQHQKPYAFVTFLDEAAQQKALERVDELKEFFPNMVAQLYVSKKNLSDQFLLAKNIKPDLTEGDVLAAFVADYGDDAIKLLRLKSIQDSIVPISAPPSGFPKAQFATIFFKDAQTANKVLASYNTMPNTKNIFITLAGHSMNILLPQRERAQFKKLKNQGRRARLLANATQMVKSNLGPSAPFRQPFGNRNYFSMPRQAPRPPQGMQRFPGAFPNMRGPMPGPGMPMGMMPPMGPGGRMPPGIPRPPMGVLPQEGASKPQEVMSLKNIKDDLTAFLGRSEDDKRYILGNLLFPLIQPHCKDPTMAPKITGMLIDFTVFDVADILEVIETPETLLERVKEGEELLEEMKQQDQAAAAQKSGAVEEAQSAEKVQSGDQKQDEVQG